MKRWRLQSQPGVESLEGRALLSTVHVAATTAKPSASSNSKFPPYNITAEIAPVSDPDGSGNIFRKSVEVTGVAPPYATLWLAQGTRPGYFTNIAVADSSGNYKFHAPVGYGTTVLQVFAENVAQDYSNVATVTATRGNAIVAWDSLAFGSFVTQGTSAAESARDLAILHAAQYDAVSAFNSPNSAYQVHLTPPKGASVEAAADSAAYTVLQGLFPTLQPTLLAAYNSAVAGLGTSPSVTPGLDFGIKVGQETLADRALDGSNSAAVDTPSNVPGLWRPTPPSYAPAVDSQFGQVTPFVISSGSEFRPAAPPGVGTTAFDQALAQVTSLGRSDSKTRTADQTASALFWSDGTYSSPYHWNEIAESLSVSRKDSLAKDAKIFAQLDFALADAGIASSDSQYTFDEWRPITAVQQFDPTWNPLLTTPASPSYVSDSAAYGGAASEVLASAFGSKVNFTANVGGTNGLSRSFSSFSAAATDEANSRIWGGVNFSFDTQAGLTLGDQVGQAVVSKFPKGK